ncbi:MAG: aldehyde dehydrogenase family protein [Candidatus Xenobiia bacterium LiM19]
MKEFGLFINGGFKRSTDSLQVNSPYSGAPVTLVSLAGKEEIEEAVSSSLKAFQQTRSLPTYKRAEFLTALKDSMTEQRENFARIITSEAGKPIVDARAEVDRSILTVSLAAEEARRIAGEVFPLDIIPQNTGRFALTSRFPIGPILAITPFNFPLNLGMHKVAPAIAAGNSVIWKPASQTPGAALLFAAVFASAAQKVDFPVEALNVVVTRSDLAEYMVVDERIAMLSFTGSAPVGWHLKKICGKKKAALELGGNAGVIIDADADLDYAVSRCITGGFSFAGQVCISVQRIFVHEKVYRDFINKLVEAAQSLICGDPEKEETKVGPLITEHDVERILKWVDEARKDGATLKNGNVRSGNIIEPTILTNVKSEMKVCCNEIFGPVVTVSPFALWEDAVRAVNDSKFGLQAGVFTRNLERAFYAFQNLEVGGVIVGDVPTFRADNMPYGGVKNSGQGREGVRYTMEEMTELKLMAFNLHS